MGKQDKLIISISIAHRKKKQDAQWNQTVIRVSRTVYKNKPRNVGVVGTRLENETFLEMVQQL